MCTDTNLCKLEGCIHDSLSSYQPAVVSPSAAQSKVVSSTLAGKRLEARWRFREVSKIKFSASHLLLEIVRLPCCNRPTAPKFLDSLFLLFLGDYSWRSLIVEN